MNIQKDLRGYLFYHLYRIEKNTIGILSKLILILLCYSKDIKIGRKMNVYGVPSIRRFPLSKIIIGNNCTINSYYNSTGIGVFKKSKITTVDRFSEIRIGNNVGLTGVTILAANKIVIEDNVIIGAHSTIMDTDRHSPIPGQRLTGKVSSKPIIIKSGAWIGMNSTILKGVVIGENSIIGANSLVTKDIPDNVIAGGNPCKVIKKLND